MADWDSADLLLRCRRLAKRPASSESMVSDDASEAVGWYALLTEAQHYYYRQFAVHCPHVLLSAPTAMATADNGATYTFASSIRPLFVMVYSAAANGIFLRPGSYDDPNADYVWEGDKIRMPLGRTRTFADGPVSRHVAPPTAIDASTEPTLQPDFARILLVYRAVAEYFRQGDLADPSPFENKENMLAWGDPRVPGDVGIMGQLKLDNPFKGFEAFAQPGLMGFAYIATVDGHRAL